LANATACARHNRRLLHGFLVPENTGATQALFESEKEDVQLSSAC
jgi:hypothetical protein